MLNATATPHSLSNSCDESPTERETALETSEAEVRVEELSDFVLENIQEHGGTVHLRKVAACVLARRGEQKRSTDSNED